MVDGDIRRFSPKRLVPSLGADKVAAPRLRADPGLLIQNGAARFRP